MKLYRIDTGEGAHFARSKKHLKRAITELEEDLNISREDFSVDVVHFPISVQGILDALREGCEAAGGHEHGRLSIFGYGDE
jgi:hypothetical protein|tara:strand:+ start:1355 stop:1597 length:243 start_codon:yes stop_codon:yes gene_type:complete